MNSKNMHNLNLQIYQHTQDLQEMKDYYLVNGSQALLLNMSNVRREIARLRKKVTEERARIEASKRAQGLKRMAVEARKRAFFAKYTVLRCAQPNQVDKLYGNYQYQKKINNCINISNGF